MRFKPTDLAWSYRSSDRPFESTEPDPDFSNPSSPWLDPWMKVVLALLVSAFLVVTYLQIANMSSKFFQPSFSGAKGLLLYLVGDDLGASRAYRDHFREVYQRQPVTSGMMAWEILAGNIERLKKSAEAAYQLNSKDTKALLCLGAIALESGNSIGSSLFFDLLLKIHPDHAKGLLYSAVAQARIGNFDKALSQINRGLRDNKIAGDFYSFILLLESAGQFNAKPDPDKPWPFLAQLYRYLRVFDSSNGDRAIKYAQQAIEAKNFPAHAYVTLAVVYTKQGRLVSALEAALKATEVDPTFPDGYWRAGFLYGRLGDIANQYVMYKKAFELVPSEPFFGRNLGFVMMEKLGDAQETVNLFERAVKANPQNWLAFQWLGWAYAFLGDHEKAIHRYVIARELVQKERAKVHGEEIALERLVDIHEELASSQQALGHIDDAIATLRQAVELAPYDGGARSRLVYMLSGVNRLEESIKEITIALQLGGLTINTHSGLCSVLYTAWESQMAAACFRQVLARDPSDMRARRLLPEVLQSVKYEQENQKAQEQTQR